MHEPPNTSDGSMDQGGSGPSSLRVVNPDGPGTPPARRGRIWQRLILAVIEAWTAVRGRRRQADADEIRPHVWSSNTKRMGIRFTERVRDAWRSRWIRLHPDNEEQQKG